MRFSRAWRWCSKSNTRRQRSKLKTRGNRLARKAYRQALRQGNWDATFPPFITEYDVT